MQYAIIKTNGKQYKVTEGDTLVLDRLATDKKSIIFDEILLAVNDEDISVGKPTVDGARVEATIVEEKQGEKIRVTRFKAKSRYRKTIGFRAQQTVVKIDKINLGSSKSEKKVKESTKTESKAVKK
jgi:large subunit ribosomal protein L21